MTKNNKKRNAAEIEPTSSSAAATQRGAKVRKHKSTVNNGFGEFVGKTKGKFSHEDSKKVRETIETYCRSHNITVNKLCSETDNRSDNLRGAWREIAQVLPDRTVQSVYRHGMRIMHPFKRGVWTAEELLQLRSLVLQHGNKWAEIAAKMNRSSDSCRDKHREFCSDYTRGRWNEEETKKLEKLLRDYLKVGDDMDMAQMGKLVESKGVTVPWELLSKKMGSRSRLACFKRFEMLSGIYQKKLQAGQKRSARTTKTAAVANEDEETFPTLPSATNTGSRLTIQPAISIPSTPSPVVTDILPDPAPAGAKGKEAVAEKVVAPSAITHISRSTPNPIHQDPAINASDIANKTKSESIPLGDSKVSVDYDQTLITFIASSSYYTKAHVDWASIRYPCGSAEERWDELLDTFVENIGDDDIYDRPIWEIARLMLSRDDNDDKVEQAEIAARTVEAVFRL
mmetsp:Transcript_17146/g.25590  ORF Transcript_17146/g.25590 Transcript_17146/m.25590 type:complete len:455 (-) Transcript_17146:3260-4624(-)